MCVRTTVRAVPLILIFVASLQAAVACAGVPRFELELLGVATRGNGSGAESRRIRRVEDIDRGRGASIAAHWAPLDAWRFSLEYTRSDYEYNDPREFYCPVAARTLSGSGFCQAGFRPSIGTIEDRYRQMRFGAARSWRVGSRSRFSLAAGSSRARWYALQDTEADTLSSCLDDRFVVPLVIPGCQPIRRDARRNGWYVDGRLMVPLSATLAATVGVHWQSFRYRIFRNDAAPRFCALNDPEAAFCSSLDVLLASTAFEDGDWTWWSGELAWTPTARWELAVQVEAGGMRGWETAGVALRYRW